MAKKTITLSVVLAVFNEAKNIRRCLSSVSVLADEIIVVDGGSTDETVALARKDGARVYVRDNPRIFHINKQKAVEYAKGSWILQLDADEVVDEALQKEIRSVIHDTGAADGYFVPRRNYFLGRWLRKGGQHPDYVIRLFRNGRGSFPMVSVHEQISIRGTLGHLKNPLDHFSYTSVDQYWRKSNSYIRLTADELSKQRDSRSIGVALSYMLVRPFVTFVLIYFRHKGFLDGWQGFLFALFSAMHYPKAYAHYLSQK